MDEQVKTPKTPAETPAKSPAEIPAETPTDASASLTFAGLVRILLGAPEFDPTANAMRRRGLLGLSAAAIALVAVASVWWHQRDPSVDPAPPQSHVVFADIEGWYRETPHEVALRTPYDLTLDALPESLPLNIGPWAGEEREHDPAVDEWFRDPELSIERTYRRFDGEIVWLSAFGSRGTKSYHLFEHTPETCYPLGGWNIQLFEPRAFELGGQSDQLTTNYGEALNQDGQQLVFVYLYIWRDPGRDPEAGVLSLRLASPVRHSVEATRAALAQDFLTRLFPSTHGWSRF